MKKSMFGRITAAAVALTIVTTCVLGGTMARFIKYRDYDMDVQVAQFNAKLLLDNVEMKDLHIALADKKVENTKVAEGKIAPGDTGKFVIKFDVSKVDVDAICTARIEGISDIKSTMPSEFDGYGVTAPVITLGGTDDILRFKVDGAYVTDLKKLVELNYSIKDTAATENGLSKEVTWDINDTKWDELVNAFITELDNKIESDDTLDAAAKATKMRRSGEYAMELVNMRMLDNASFIVSAAVTQAV